MRLQPTTSAPDRPPSNLRALIALNALLLGLLATVTFAPKVSDQARARGAYTMVAGGAINTQSAVIYIVDTVNLRRLEPHRQGPRLPESRRRRRGPARPGPGRKLTWSRPR